MGGEPEEVPAPRLAVVYCAVLEMELEHLARQVPNIVRFEKLPQGLHNEPTKLKSALQEAIDRVEAETDAEAIVLGYGLCSRGAEGVVSKRALLVLPRAHDCITLLLGSKERYAEYVAQNPGTYWYSPGWNKHHIPPGPVRHKTLRDRYLEKFDEDTADYLMEQEQAWFQHYDRATYVDQGVGATPEDVAYTQGCANWLGWKFDRLKGDPGLMRALIASEWDEDRFLVLQPGESAQMTADARVVEAVRG